MDLISAKQVVCIAPGSSDKLVLMNHNPKVVQAVQSAIASTWHRGIQDFQEGMHDNHTFHEFKLKGNPWWSATDETVEARKLLLEIIVQMAIIGFKYHATINIKVSAK